MKRRKMFKSMVICFVAFFLMVSTTYAWLTRHPDDKSISIDGFSYQANTQLLTTLFDVETYYKNPGDSLKFLSKSISITPSGDYTKNLIRLVPGYRTEFETTITNISKNTIEYTAYLSKVSISDTIAPYISFGAYEPALLMHKGNDYDLVDDKYYADLITLIEGGTIGPNESVKIKWYLSLDKAFENDEFYALCDQDGNIITVNENDEDYYYSVIDYSAFEDEIYHAYKVNKYGEFVDSTNQITTRSDKLVEYSGDYTNCTAEYFDCNAIDYAVRIEGIFVAAGKKIEE